MADNTTLNAGTGGDVIASDDIGGVKYQRVKLSLGADGTAADAPVGGGVEAASLRVTIASDSTGVLSVDDNGGSLTVDGTVTANLAAGTNNIGDVDVLSVVPGTGATSLGKAEDAAHASGDVGVMALAVRRDADTTLADTTGDYAPLQVNASGSLKVAITSGAGSGGTSIADGASFTRDTTSLTPVGGVVEASAPTVTAGDAVALSMTTGGAVRVAVASGGITGVVEDAASAGGEEGLLMIGVRRDTAASSSGTDGDFSTLNLDSTGRLHVNVGNTVTVGSHAVTNAGTFATQVDGAALTALQLIDNACIADDAAFTPASSGVHVSGFFADETATDSIDEGDAGAARMTLDRKQIVTSYAHAAAGGTSNYTALSTAAVLTAEIKGSAGKVYSLEVFNVNAAARYVRLYNQTGAPASTDTANVVWQGVIPGATTGGGFTITWPLGKQFTTGIGIRASTGIAHNDTGALAANELTFNVSYA